MILAVTDDSQSTKSWDTGAVGEERLDQKLNELASDTIRVLHDRRIPGTRANIDHIVITSTGVYVIDLKRYAGRPTLEIEGGFLRPRTEKLLVSGRDRTKLVDGVLEQVELIHSIVGDEVPVRRPLLYRSRLADDRPSLHDPRSRGPLSQEALPASESVGITTDRGRRPASRVSQSPTCCLKLLGFGASNCACTT